MPKAKKSPKLHLPIESPSFIVIHDSIKDLPVHLLKDLCRQFEVPIAKYKDQIVHRLALCIHSHNPHITIRIR